MYLLCLLVQKYVFAATQRETIRPWHCTTFDNDLDKASYSSLVTKIPPAFNDTGKTFRYVDLLAEFIIQREYFTSENLQKHVRRAIAHTEKEEEFYQILLCFEEAKKLDYKVDSVDLCVSEALTQYARLDNRSSAFHKAFAKKGLVKQQIDQQLGTESEPKLDEEVGCSIHMEDVDDSLVETGIKIKQLHSFLISFNNLGNSVFLDIGIVAQSLKTKLSKEGYEIAIDIITKSMHHNQRYYKWRFQGIILKKDEPRNCEETMYDIETAKVTPGELIEWCIDNIDYLSTECVDCSEFPQNIQSKRYTGYESNSCEDSDEHNFYEDSEESLNYDIIYMEDQLKESEAKRKASEARVLELEAKQKELEAPVENLTTIKRMKIDEEDGMDTE